MSIHVIELIYRRQLGSYTDDCGVTTSAATRKAVAVALAFYAERDGSRIFPAVPTIARHIEMKDRAVQIAIRGLVAQGLLAVVRRGGRGQHSTTEYRLDLDRLAQLPRVHPDREGRKGALDAPLKGAPDAPLPAPRVHVATSKGASHAPDPSEIRQDSDLSPPTPRVRKRRTRGASGRGSSDGGEVDQLLAPLRTEPAWANALSLLIEPIVRQRKILAPDPADLLRRTAGWAADLPVATLRAATYRLLQERHSAVTEESIVAAVRAVQKDAGLQQTRDRPAAPAVEADGLVMITERDQPAAFRAWLAHYEAQDQAGALKDGRALRHIVTLASKHRALRVPSLTPPTPPTHSPDTTVH
jgi:hypothetical protein